MWPYQKTRILVVISISLTIAAIHFFRFGSYLNGDWYLYYYSYASDILIPIGFYFLLSINDVQIRFLRSWKVKAIIIFGLSSLTEIMQAFGIYVLGVTFDPYDILMFGIGTMCAVSVDQLFLKRFVPYWNLDSLDQ